MSPTQAVLQSRTALASTQCAVLLLLAAAAAPAPDELRLEGTFRQGGLARGYAPPGAELRFAGRLVRTGQDGLFVIGFGRDAPPRAVLTLRYPDGRVQRKEFSVEQRRYQTQHIKGLPPKMVTPSEKDLARIRRENARVAETRRRDDPRPFFKEGFAWPLKGRISGVYGSRRILNGEPRRPHYGIDIAAPTGTPVRAPAPGIVTLAARDMYFTGGTLILDHGHGLSSTLIHLSKLLVREGEEVRRGQAVGEVGATGRATGPHLDWRINLFDTRLDPALVAESFPAAALP